MFKTILNYIPTLTFKKLILQLSIIFHLPLYRVSYPESSLIKKEILHYPAFLSEILISNDQSSFYVSYSDLVDTISHYFEKETISPRSFVKCAMNWPKFPIGKKAKHSNWICTWWIQ